MATKTFCDKCGAEAFVHHMEPLIANVHSFRSIARADLCEWCWRRLDRWLHTPDPKDDQAKVKADDF